MTELNFLQDFESPSTSAFGEKTPCIRISSENGEKRKEKTEKKKESQRSTKKDTVSLVGTSKAVKEKKTIGKKVGKKVPAIKKPRKKPTQEKGEGTCSRTKRYTGTLLRKVINEKNASASSDIPDLALATLGLMTAFQELTKMIDVKND